MPDFSLDLDCKGYSAYIKDANGLFQPIGVSSWRVATDGCGTVPEIELSGYLVGRGLKHFFGKRSDPMAYEKVIYNDPATIVLWADGTKTVVKCDPKDKYDKTKGLALCFMKKALGNTSRALNDILHKEEGK